MTEILHSNIKRELFEFPLNSKIAKYPPTLTKNVIRTSEQVEIIVEIIIAPLFPVIHPL